MLDEVDLVASDFKILMKVMNFPWKIKFVWV